MLMRCFVHSPTQWFIPKSSFKDWDPSIGRILIGLSSWQIVFPRLKTLKLLNHYHHKYTLTAILQSLSTSKDCRFCSAYLSAKLQMSNLAIMNFKAIKKIWVTKIDSFSNSTEIVHQINEFILQSGIGFTEGNEPKR